MEEELKGKPEERKRLRDRIKESLLKAVKEPVRAVPVYGDYKIEERIREWDRSVRDEAVFDLTRAEKDTVGILDLLLSKRDKGMIREVERTRGAIHAVKEKIRIGPYGYWPRLSPIKIDETVLQHMLFLDETIVAESEGVFSRSRGILEKFRRGQEKEGVFDLQSLSENFDRIDKLLAERFELLRTGKIGGGP